MPPVHDYVIDNSTGANVRADINNALLAISSNNSSSSEPSTKYAYMWWADTNTGILKIRNSANDGWVELLQLDGTLTLEDGTVSSPGLAFRDDLNTGIYSSGADKFNVAAGGNDMLKIGNNEIVFNDEGRDADFRIEGDAVTNLFYLDASEDRVGIATNSPSTRLHVNGNITINDKIIHDGDTNTSIRFPSADTVSVETNGVQRLQIDANGTTISTVTDASLFINTTNANGSHIRLQTSGTTKTFLGQASGISGTLGNADDFGVMTAGKFSVGTNGSATKRFEIETSGDVKVSTGNLVIGTDGKGIDFASNTENESGAGSSYGTVLDDYEEGSWTPTFDAPNQSSTTFGLNHQYGYYTKIGNLVHVTCYLQGFADQNTSGGSNDGIVITGLPFTVANLPGGGNTRHAASFAVGSRYRLLVDDLIIHAFGNQNVAKLLVPSNGQVMEEMKSNQMTARSGTNEVYFAGSYRVHA